MRVGIFAIALAVTSVLGCQAADASLEKPDTEAKKITKSSAKNPQLTVGDVAVTTEDGNKLAVLSYKSPVTIADTKPKPGFEYSVIEVEGCSSRSSGQDEMYVGANASPCGCRIAETYTLKASTRTSKSSSLH